jgi:hypothetical protein
MIPDDHRALPDSVEDLVRLWDRGNVLASQVAEVRGLLRELVAAITAAQDAGLPMANAQPQQDRLTAACRVLQALREEVAPLGRR